jgi:solute carrier family 25 (adenine nucleotide translocator) protein 4/5/6/31
MDHASAPPLPPPVTPGSSLLTETASPPASSSAPYVPQSYSTARKRQTPAKDALAGACAGAIAKTVVAPIERVKLLMQLQFSIDNNAITGGKTSTANADTALLSGMKRRCGAWGVAKRVYKEQGVLAFWRGESADISRGEFTLCTSFGSFYYTYLTLRSVSGNTPNVIRQGGSSAMNFLLMDWYKIAISPLLVWSLNLPSNRDPEKRHKRRALFSSFLSGGLAGGSVTTVLYPVEFVRTRLAMDLGKGTVEAPRLYPGGMRDVCLSIWKADGWRGLYQGYGIAVAGVILYRALHLGGYDAVKTEILHRRGHYGALGDFSFIDGENQIARNHENDKFLAGIPQDSQRISSGLTVGERFLAAQIVSIVAGTACYPIDSIRRRLMMQAGLPKEDRLYKNSLDCFRKVIALEGPRGFYLGIGPNLVRSFGAALLLVTYDILKIKIS